MMLLTFILSFFNFYGVAELQDPLARIKLAVTHVVVKFIGLVILFWAAKLIYRTLPDSYANHFMWVLVGTAAGVLGASIASLALSFVLPFLF